MKQEILTVVIARRGINDEGKGKKHALKRLIEAVHTEYVWLRDDDIQPPALSPNDMAEVLHRLHYPDLLILPLRMTKGNGTLIERLQQAEYAAIQQLTIETAQRGRAVMCSGANLIVRRDRWLESYKDLHPELPSGDDMFLLESFKRRGLSITVWDAKEAEASVTPCPDLPSLWRQRTRWAGKAARFTDKDIRRCGGIVLTANILQLLFPPLVVIKFPVEYALIRKRNTASDDTVTLLTALLLELVYPIYMLACLIGGLLKSRKAAPAF